MSSNMTLSSTRQKVTIGQIIAAGYEFDNRTHNTEMKLRLSYARLNFLDNGHCPAGCGRAKIDWCSCCVAEWVDLGGVA